MNLEAAKSQITAAFARMNALYGKAVFDEWTVVSLQAEQSGVLVYTGPRGESFRRQFATDVVPLRTEMTGRPFAVGDFEFTTEGTGTRFDACLRVGEASYLLCNHTGKSMVEIRSDPRWLQAQKAFVDLSERFRRDPLES
jgi:hypothetical protein